MQRCIYINGLLNNRSYVLRVDVFTVMKIKKLTIAMSRYIHVLLNYRCYAEMYLQKWFIEEQLLRRDI